MAFLTKHVPDSLLALSFALAALSCTLSLSDCRCLPAPSNSNSARFCLVNGLQNPNHNPAPLSGGNVAPSCLPIPRPAQLYSPRMAERGRAAPMSGEAGALVPPLYRPCGLLYACCCRQLLCIGLPGCPPGCCSGLARCRVPATLSCCTCCCWGPKRVGEPLAKVGLCVALLPAYVGLCCK